MDALRTRAAAKKRLQTRADIFGLLKNSKRTRVVKKQPKSLNRSGIFNSTFSFKVKRKNPSRTNSATRSIWTVTNNSKYKPVIQEVVQTSKAKPKRKQNVNQKDDTLVSNCSRISSFEFAGTFITNTKPIRISIIRIEINFALIFTDTPQGSVQKLLEETAEQFKSFIDGSQSTKSTEKQLNDSLRSTNSDPNALQFTFEMALKYNEAAAKRANEILLPEKRVEPKVASDWEPSAQLLHESVLFSEISELTARR